MDEELQLLRLGDRAAFERFFRTHYEFAKAMARRHLKDESDVEDIASIAFVRVHRSILNFRGDSLLKTYLARIVVNLSLNRYAYNVRRRSDRTCSLDATIFDSGSAELHEMIPSSEMSPNEVLELDELEERANEKMSRLSNHHREILDMRAHRHMAYEEIAAALGINVGTVKSRLARARTDLQALVDGRRIIITTPNARTRQKKAAQEIPTPISQAA